MSPPVIHKASRQVCICLDGPRNVLNAFKAFFSPMPGSYGQRSLYLALPKLCSSKVCISSATQL